MVALGTKMKGHVIGKDLTEGPGPLEGKDHGGLGGWLPWG